MNQPTLDEIRNLLEAMPLDRLGAFVEEIRALFAKKSNEESEVRAARAAGQTAVDALEAKDTVPSRKT